MREEFTFPFNGLPKEDPCGKIKHHPQFAHEKSREDWIEENTDNAQNPSPSWHLNVHFLCFLVQLEGNAHKDNKDNNPQKHVVGIG